MHYKELLTGLNYMRTRGNERDNKHYSILDAYPVKISQKNKGAIFKFKY